MRKYFAFFSLIFLLNACVNQVNTSNQIPQWYIKPLSNNGENLYGVAEGYSLEEATKAALADAAARLMVTISSQSTLLREENQASVNEEMRQQIKQNIEKIDFTNYQVSNSQQVGSKIYVEVKIPRQTFIIAQKEKLSFLEKQISDLNNNISGQNIIQKRNTWLKIADLQEQAIILTKMIDLENNSLKPKMMMLAKAQNELNSLNQNVEFYFEINSAPSIANVIKNALNKEKIQIAKSASNSPSQIKINISDKSSTANIYGSYITKLRITFENIAQGKIIASNEIEVSGSSVISEKESYLSAISSLKEKINDEGILKIIGII